MRIARQRIVRRLRPLLLAALLLVPIVASGHDHAAHPSARPCAVCAVTQHAPVASAPVAPVAAALPLVLSVDAQAVLAPEAPNARRATERGPPPLHRVQGT
jgi:hypothetical protein